MTALPSGSRARALRAAELARSAADLLALSVSPAGRQARALFSSAEALALRAAAELGSAPVPAVLSDLVAVSALCSVAAAQLRDAAGVPSSALDPIRLRCGDIPAASDGDQASSAAETLAVSLALASGDPEPMRQAQRALRSDRSGWRAAWLSDPLGAPRLAQASR